MVWKLSGETSNNWRRLSPAYARLRTGTYRIIVRFYAEGGRQVARCVFAEKRSVVYELFAEILRGQSGGKAE